MILLVIVGPPVEACVRFDSAIAVISAAIDGTVLEDAGSYRCRAGCNIISDCRVLVNLPRSLELGLGQHANVAYFVRIVATRTSSST